MMKLLSSLLVLLIFVLGASAQIPVLPTVSAPANLDELCVVYAPLEDMNGPLCLNPVWWDIEGFININAIVRYRDDANIIRVGRVAGYSWQRDEGRYHYLLETYVEVGVYASVAPERIDDE